MQPAEIKHEEYSLHTSLMQWGAGFSGPDPEKHLNKLFTWSTAVSAFVLYLLEGRCHSLGKQLPNTYAKVILCQKRDPELSANHPNTSLKQVVSNFCFIYLLDVCLIVFYRLDFWVNPKIFLLFPPILRLHMISWVLLFLWKKFFAPKSPAKSSDPADGAAFSTSQLSAIHLGKWEVFARLDSRQATKLGERNYTPSFFAGAACFAL